MSRVLPGSGSVRSSDPPFLVRSSIDARTPPPFSKQALTWFHWSPADGLMLLST